jgi:hypothetical protein
MAPTNDNDHSPKTCFDESDSHADFGQQDFTTFLGCKRASLNAQLESVFVDESEDGTADTSSAGDGADASTEETSKECRVDAPPVEPEVPPIANPSGAAFQQDFHETRPENIWMLLDDEITSFTIRAEKLPASAWYEYLKDTLVHPNPREDLLATPIIAQAVDVILAQTRKELLNGVDDTVVAGVPEDLLDHLLWYDLVGDGHQSM